MEWSLVFGAVDFTTIDSMGKFKVNAMPLPSKRQSTDTNRIQFNFKLDFSFLCFLKVQRSVSQSDMHGTTNVRRIRNSHIGNGGGGGCVGGIGSANSGTKLKRCASLPAQKQRQTIIAANNETRNLKTQLESSVESLGK